MQKDSWTLPPSPIELGLHQVDIWRVSLGPVRDSAQWAESTLSADETERAARFHFDADRRRFILAHACLRDILSRYLHCEPGHIIFSTNEYGKPVLTPHNSLDFNLSHSGDYVLIAVALERKVGVDVEHFRLNLEHEKIARRSFSRVEYEEVSAIPHEQKVIAFFNCWTRKEAYIKAHGWGLSLPLDSFDVSLAPDEPVVLRATRSDPNEARKWTLLSLDVHPEHAGALAVEGAGMEFRLWDWEMQ
jgi:4'-phosphopantetheinyl transferase